MQVSPRKFSAQWSTMIVGAPISQIGTPQVGRPLLPASDFGGAGRRFNIEGAQRTENPRGFRSYNAARQLQREPGPPCLKPKMPVRISVPIVACNEAANLRRTLASVAWVDEIVLVDSGSTDETLDIAREFNARIFVEPWKGYGPGVNSAIDKCTGDWILN